MKKLYVLLAAFWLIGVIVFPGSPKLKSPANDAKYKCSQYSIPSLVPGKDQDNASCCKRWGRHVKPPAIIISYSPV
jgi:hypothetical protein